MLEPKVSEASVSELDLDPEFQAELLKAEFTELVFKRLDFLGMKQSGLARRIGVSRQSLHEQLQDETNYTLESIASICAGLQQQLYIHMGDPGAHHTCWPVFKSNLQKNAPISKDSDYLMPLNTNNAKMRICTETLGQETYE